VTPTTNHIPYGCQAIAAGWPKLKEIMQQLLDFPQSLQIKIQIGLVLPGEA
jgi:hypothetical protein